MDSIKPETMSKLKSLLTEMRRDYYDALAVSSGMMMKYIVSEEEAQETIGNIEKHLKKQENKNPFCCRCKEDFPVKVCDTKNGGWSMGELRLLKYAPTKIKNQFREWLKSELHGEGYLCGSCYFDLT